MTAARGAEGRPPARDARRALLVLAMLATLSCSPARAAEESAATPTTPPALPSLQLRQQRLLDYTPAAPELPASGAGMTPETRAAYEAALRAYYAYRVRGYEQRLQAFEWQGWSSKAIFFAVLLLVLAGILFAALQFGAGMRRPGGATATELAIDLKGVRVSSPVLGVVLLSISLAFFYLYLVYVYPIVNVF